MVSSTASIVDIFSLVVFGQYFDGEECHLCAAVPRGKTCPANVGTNAVSPGRSAGTYDGTRDWRIKLMRVTSLNNAFVSAPFSDTRYIVYRKLFFHCQLSTSRQQTIMKCDGHGRHIRMSLPIPEQGVTRYRALVLMRCLIFLFVLASLWTDALTDDQQRIDDAVAAADVETCIDSVRDEVDDSLFEPFQADHDSEGNELLHPPISTIEEEIVSAMELGDSGKYREDIEEENQGQTSSSEYVVDQHWGSDPEVLKMRDALRRPEANRPPIFLVPGLAASRLVAWRHKECRHKPLMSDIRVQDYVWLNLNIIMQMGTIDDRCFVECIKLGLNQSDSVDGGGCKLRSDEGLDAISSLSVGGLQSQLLIGRTNTVYSWLIQWLSDNLGYDVGSIIGFPYDWRLSPDKMEERDGFFTFMRRRIETAVETNGEPGILVAHSMGNMIFRYFLSWLKVELAAEAYSELLDEGSSQRENKYANRRRSHRSRLVKEMQHENANATLVETAKRNGEKRWHEWIESHIWTYAGLSAPHIGAVNPLRAAISGETMGLPVAEDTIREIEITFGSTLTVNPLSSQVAFCDEHDFRVWDEEPERGESNRRLDCLDDLALMIQNHSNETHDPWRGFEALKSLLLHRMDWDTDFPMITVIQEDCDSEAGSFCLKRAEEIGPKDVQNGLVFRYFSQLWKEDGDPLYVKYEQLRDSFWSGHVPNLLTETWERPPIKHVLMAYGTDHPTEVGYTYLKRQDSRENMCKKSDIPNLQTVLTETKGGQILEERLDAPKGLFSPKKPKQSPLMQGSLKHSGDGSVPYLSLSFAHLWLLYGYRMQMRSGRVPFPQNPLNTIQESYRPKGGMEWKNGIPESLDIAEDNEKDSIDTSDTGTLHPHGTKYKPLMHRFHSSYTLDSAPDVKYTTTVIEASGVEHKETTRNYDILAAVFTDVLKAMHSDFDVPSSDMEG